MGKGSIVKSSSAPGSHLQYRQCYILVPEADEPGSSVNSEGMVLWDVGRLLLGLEVAFGSQHTATE
eukprot:CAMPEP_0174306306 /NCGR_PEP_ID=MMETSP0810-20121108/360_1 /TAXON_ID=73025 ORGANISM="Eutreptiella gymnastica-like, Strain CCMP1594" /NCGR_SAMPLE_ID=MMETSP0810 /ASSEMBLY_ACC=CAM_ASM_000659 /LENGTH=65 /DNA_ID=CAMNT_0015412971 /DNA_START=2223 /DNA_END=2420 /DNA_ORIENTATION=+